MLWHQPEKGPRQFGILCSKRLPISAEQHSLPQEGLALAPEPRLWPRRLSGKRLRPHLGGRAIGGSWAVEDGHIRVRTMLGEKSAPLEEADGVWVAWRLLREMAAEGKA